MGATALLVPLFGSAGEAKLADIVNVINR